MLRASNAAQFIPCTGHNLLFQVGHLLNTIPLKISLTISLSLSHTHTYTHNLSHNFYLNIYIYMLYIYTTKIFDIRNGTK